MTGAMRSRCSSAVLSKMPERCSDRIAFSTLRASPEWSLASGGRKRVTA